jgi:hypothetical protein
MASIEVDGKRVPLTADGTPSVERAKGDVAKKIADLARSRRMADGD